MSVHKNMPTGTNAIGSGTDNRLKNTRGSLVIAFMSFSILNQHLIAHLSSLILFFLHNFNLLQNNISYHYLPLLIFKIFFFFGNKIHL